MKVADLIDRLNKFSPDTELVCTAIANNPDSTSCCLHLIEHEGRTYLTLVAIEPEEDGLF